VQKLAIAFLEQIEYHHVVSPFVKKWRHSVSKRQFREVMMAEEEMVRVTVRVPESTRDQLDQWAAGVGVRSSHFVSMSLMRGARELAGEFGLLQRHHCAMPDCEEYTPYGVAPELVRDTEGEPYGEYYWCDGHRAAGGFDRYVEMMSNRRRDRENASVSVNGA
jgi:hypothetical protein